MMAGLYQEFFVSDRSPDEQVSPLSSCGDGQSDTVKLEQYFSVVGQSVDRIFRLLFAVSECDTLGA